MYKEYEEDINTIFELMREGKVVVWAGAGFSYSAGLPSGNGLNEMLLDKFFSNEERKTFIDISTLRSTVDRIKFRGDNLIENEEQLFQYLKDIFVRDNCDGTVHKRLSKIPYIKDIVTTNYDNLFELAYGDRLDVIYDNQSFSERKNKFKLYKIHGDIFHPNDIILSDWDYEIFIKDNACNSNLLATKIKEFFATKIILFIGFSYEDINIGALHNEILDILKNTDKRHYLVAPSLENYKINKLKNKGIKYIDSNAEQILFSIEERTNRYLMRDLENGIISYEDVKNVTKESGFYPEIQSCKGEIFITDFCSLDNKEITIEGTFEVNAESEELEKLENIVRGNSYEPVKFSDGFIKNITMSVQGMTLEEFGSVTDVTMIPCAKYIGPIDVYYDKISFPIDASAKVFKTFNEICYKFDIGDLHIKIVRPVNVKKNTLQPNSITWHYNIKGETVSEIAKSVNALLQFFDSEDTKIRYKRNCKVQYQNIINSDIYETEEFQSCKRMLQFRYNIFMKLSFIESFYEIEFKITEKDVLTEDVISIITIVYLYIKDKEYINSRKISLQFGITNGQEEYLLTPENLPPLNDISATVCDKTITFNNWKIIKPYKIHKIEGSDIDDSNGELVHYECRQENMLFTADISII